jgi:hypothetical protein
MKCMWLKTVEGEEKRILCGIYLGKLGGLEFQLVTEPCRLSSRCGLSSRAFIYSQT